MYVLFSIYFSEINFLIKNIGEKNLLFQGIHIGNKLNARNTTWLLDDTMFKFFKINIENLKKWIDEIKTTQKKSNCDFDCGCHKSQRDESLKLSIIGELKHRILCN